MRVGIRGDATLNEVAMAVAMVAVLMDCTYRGACCVLLVVVARCYGARWLRAEDGCGA